MAEPRPNSILNAITENSDVAMAIAVIGILVIMILPLPTWILDILLTFNIAFSLVILMVSMYIVKPLDIAVFPGLLLIMTLFRLGLNVATTRLILGKADAGEVIMAFGNYVVSGNYVVGFIVFLILILINFLVIVKGAGRIAEVAARFTLDAMPGKQMAVDADLNAGTISDEEAKHRRDEISREAEFHGAMDGAAKFVKGDAIAGLIITGINILGGFIIGVLQLDMGWSESIETYSMLTIGDGLVSQIPGLIVSTSAGLIVTRAASEGNLGSDIQKQLLGQPKALIIASGALFLFGTAPGLPFIPFFLLSALAGITGFIAMQSKDSKEATGSDVEEMIAPPEDKIEDYLQVDPLELEIGYGIIPLVDVEQGGDLLGRITTMRKQIASEMGFIVPPIRIRDNIQLGTSSYTVKIRGVDVSDNEVFPGMYLAMNPGTATKELKGTETTEPAFGLSAYWVDEDSKEEAELHGYTVVESSAVIATHLMEIIKNNADKIMSRQDVKELIDNAKKDYQAVVDEVIPQLSVGAVQKVLQNLLREKIPVRDLVTILETLADFIPMTRDTQILTEYVRQALGNTITHIYLSDDNKIHAITLDPQIEQTIDESARAALQAGTAIGLPPDLIRQMLTQLTSFIDEMISKGHSPLIITSPSIRMHVRALLETALPGVGVISYSEILPTIQVESEGGINAN